MSGKRSLGVFIVDLVECRSVVTSNFVYKEWIYTAAAALESSSVHGALSAKSHDTASAALESSTVHRTPCGVNVNML